MRLRIYGCTLSFFPERMAMALPQIFFFEEGQEPYRNILKIIKANTRSYNQEKVQETKKGGEENKEKKN